MPRIRHSNGAEAAGESIDSPAVGMPLGVKLAISTSLVVTLFMAAVTLLAQDQDIRAQRALHMALLRKGLAPLALQIEGEIGLEGIRNALALFHDAYVQRGYPDHHLELRDNAGRLIETTLKLDSSRFTDRWEASVPIRSTSLPEGFGTLTVQQSAVEFNEKVSRRWRTWWIHVGMTFALMNLLLIILVRGLVTKPLARLIDGVEKMARGYWLDIPNIGGCWEMRWLGWQFRNLGIELQNSVTQLLHAERRAMDDRRDSSAADEKQDAHDFAEESGPSALEREIRRSLLETCQMLESMPSGHPGARRLAMVAWERDSIEAVRIGDASLKARLEDVALRHLEPEAYSFLEGKLAELGVTKTGSIQAREDYLCRQLEAGNVPVLETNHRIKNVGSIWKKMRSKGLSFSQIHDVLAFRVIVPTEQDCYTALGVVHRLFPPIVGRFDDYVALPKANGYQSLHTCCVTSGDGFVFEIQIRSAVMHRDATRGDAAEWHYKKDNSLLSSAG